VLAWDEAIQKKPTERLGGKHRVSVRSIMQNKAKRAGEDSRFLSLGDLKKITVGECADGRFALVSRNEQAKSD